MPDNRNEQSDKATHEGDMQEHRPLITVSVPVYNEEDNVKPLLERLTTVAEKETSYGFEFLFTDNASTDSTFEKLAILAEKDERIRVLRFSRNFGFQKSILTNFLNARGVAAVQLDADMQDPPEMISDFLRAWEQGYKVVYGIRKHRKEFFLLHSARKLYYLIVSWLSDIHVPLDAGDFRLIDRVIFRQLANINEQTPYLRGLIANMGYPQKGIPYDRDARKAGKSKFHLFQLVELGLDGITSQSTRPLRLITMFGFIISFFSALAILYYLGLFLFLKQGMPGGFTTIVLLVLVSIGLNSFFLGLMGEYVGRVFNNTRGLPISIIEQRIEPLGENSGIAADDLPQGQARTVQHPGGMQS